MRSSQSSGKEVATEEILEADRELEVHSAELSTRLGWVELQGAKSWPDRGSQSP